MQIKTRFAPSPTGNLHLGSVRTALYSWLFARRNNGIFILRIEDTDLGRSTKESINSIIDAMRWLNIDWNEGPYYQTERFDRYNDIMNNMLKNGTAYKCFCSKERLECLRKSQILAGKKPKYDGFCRKNFKSLENKSYVVRFCNPISGHTTFHDQIRGKITFNNAELDDLIIRRTNGSYTYNFCVAIDDYDMNITHVIRGEDHINNTPRQINILKAIGANIPIYAHISMIFGVDGKKLSKRNAALSILQYRDEGYLPEAMLNYLVRLGWSHNNKEIFSISEMINLFTLSSVNKSPSIFDIKKLKWMNHQYINRLPVEYIAKCLHKHINNQKININAGLNLTKVVKLFSKRCNTLKDIAISCRYCYEEFSQFDSNHAKKYLNNINYPLLEYIRNQLLLISDWNSENIQNTILSTANKFNVNVNKIYMLLRLTITGIHYSPAINDIIEIIGLNTTISRIEKALTFINNNVF
ncbi:glutamate--tRNA ligase [Candidatus Pantoea edessiphila]|uniref:Glutamate--tRNA ligase n=1 Tax=Candidatus Pantoea edessiphila TaxID=2044610 RepID=A0A2P5SWK7_9GAMM|nr:glutamate--tRNA ligase [Candidatus Pantoea edessiphila]PPI86704.1 glutamate--tRNA ligase [Candidatus Pantoea edessiphila]